MKVFNSLHFFEQFLAKASRILWQVVTGVGFRKEGQWESFVMIIWWQFAKVKKLQHGANIEDFTALQPENPTPIPILCVSPITPCCFVPCCVKLARPRQHVWCQETKEASQKLRTLSNVTPFCEVNHICNYFYTHANSWPENLQHKSLTTKKRKWIF